MENINKIKSLAVVGNAAFTMLQFRGSMISFLSKAGYRVYCFAPDFTPDAREEIKSLGGIPVDMKFSRSKTSFFDGIFSLIDLYKKFRFFKVDLVFSYFLKPIIISNLAAFLARVPIRYSMIEGRGSIFNDANDVSYKIIFLRFIVKVGLFCGLKVSHKVFVLNRRDYGFVINELHIKSNKVTIIPGIGLDLNYFVPHKISSDRIRFIFCGRLLVSKGIKEVLRAAQQIYYLNHDCEFLVIGDVDESIETIDAEELRDFHDRGFINWIGFQKDINKFFHRHSVLLLPTYYPEGLPRTIQEAFAMSCPVITTNAPGCGEYIDEGDSGYVINAQDTPALVASCLKFIKNPESIVRMGSAGRNYALSNYDAEKINYSIFSSIIPADGK
jgi:glycosyltransferase involved in cell wall biosynthesis